MKTHTSCHDVTKAIPASLQGRKEALLKEFDAVSGKGGVYSFLIEQARKMPPPPPTLKTDENLLPGCLYNIWMSASGSEGRLWITATSDSKITKGGIAVVQNLLSGLTADEIIDADLEFLYEDILHEAFHSTRYNSIRNMVDRLKTAAIHLRREAS